MCIRDSSNAGNSNNGKVFTIYGDSPAINLIHNTSGGSAASDDYSAINFGRNGSSSNPFRAIIGYKQDGDALHIKAQGSIKFDVGGNINTSGNLTTIGSDITFNAQSIPRTVTINGNVNLSNNLTTTGNDITINAGNSSKNITLGGNINVASGFTTQNNNVIIDAIGGERKLTLSLIHI